MELKPGYKQTEVGVIPEEWDCVHIGNVAETSSGATPPRAKQQEYFDGGTIPWVKTLDLNNSSILETDECVTSSALQQTSLRVYPSGSVLVAMYGGFNQIGRTGMLTKDATINQALTAIRPDRSRLSSRFLLNYLNYRVEYWKSVASSSRKDPNITGRDVREFPIPLPPLKEQEAVGEALQDAEDQISILEELIAKKRDIKQAAMQELLTGKRRLPGFEGEWEVKRLGEIGTWRGGMTPSMQNPSYWVNGDFPWISSGDVKSSQLLDTNQHVTSHAVKQGAAVDVPAQTLVLVTRSGILRKHLPVARIDKPMAINQDIKALIPHEGFCSKFLLHALTWAGNEILSSCMKSGTTVESVEFSWLKAFVLSIPLLEEQEAIASVLSDMDAEISALDDQRDRTRALKQAMMQELLTGRIRLV